MYLTTHTKQYKATKKVVEDLNKSTHRHGVVEILYWQQNTSDNGLGNAKKSKFIATGQARIISTPFTTQSNHDQRGILIKDHNSEYLNGNNKYSKTLQYTYNLLEGWNNHTPKG